MRKKILLAGGAGYIGTVLAHFFLNKNYEVWCLDSLIYKQKKNINNLKKHKRFRFFKGDIRDNKLSRKILKKVDHVVILAGLVGDPITNKYKRQSKSINTNGMKNFIKICLNSQIQKMIFVSTCSNYGLIKSRELAKENHVLKPLSLYAKSKVEVEKYILKHKGKTDVEPVILRFATAFGFSPRMRFDLTVNEFVRDLLMKKTLTVYDENTWRPYCHVNDFAILIKKVLDFKKRDISFQIFNAGDEVNNYTKKGIVKKIKKFIPNSKIKFQKHGHDPRNYKVNFSKVKKTFNFKAKVNLEKGISEIILNIKKNKILFLNQKKSKDFGNYKITL